MANRASKSLRVLIPWVVAAMSFAVASVVASLPASASVISTTHETPWTGEVGVKTLCAPSASYDCTKEAYATWATNPSGWAWTDYGNGVASENSFGPHNCTLYVAYRLQQSGLAYPGWHGNADNWATDAAAAGIEVNDTPSVGAVAQWNNPSTGGHVAFVDRVTSSYVVVTADNYQRSTATFMPGGYTDSYEISLTSPAMPDNFIHFGSMVAAPSAPSNGSFVSYHAKSYVIAGGSPEYVSNWSAVGGAQSAQVLNATQWADLAPQPADGTFLCAGGAAYVVAGGAPEYVSSWAAVGGQQPCTTIDPADVTNAGTASPWNHLNAFPSNGAFIINAETGTSFEVVGGFALPVDSCVAVAGCTSGVSIDPATFVNVGGAAPWNHLKSEPTNGSSIEDTVTSTYWTFTNGCRSESATALTSVAIDAAMFDEILPCPTTPPAPAYQSLVARKGSLVIRITSVPNPTVPIITYQYSLNAGKSWLNEPHQGAPLIVVRFLAQGRSYEVSIRAVGSVGPSAASKVVVATTL